MGPPHFNICYKIPAYPELRNRIYAAFDAIFADDRLTRKSQQGHLIFYNSGPIIWKSNRQRTIVLSTTEAELDSFVSCQRRRTVRQTTVIFFKVGFDRQQKVQVPVHDAPHNPSGAFMPNQVVAEFVSSLAAPAANRCPAPKTQVCSSFEEREKRKR